MAKQYTNLTGTLVEFNVETKTAPTRVTRSLLARRGVRQQRRIARAI